MPSFSSFLYGVSFAGAFHLCSISFSFLLGNHFLSWIRGICAASLPRGMVSLQRCLLCFGADAVARDGCLVRSSGMGCSHHVTTREAQSAQIHQKTREGNIFYFPAHLCLHCSRAAYRRRCVGIGRCCRGCSPTMQTLCSWCPFRFRALPLPPTQRYSPVSIYFALCGWKLSSPSPL